MVRIPTWHVPKLCTFVWVDVDDSKIFLWHLLFMRLQISTLHTIDSIDTLQTIQKSLTLRAEVEYTFV